MGKMILVTQSVFQKGLSTSMTFYFPHSLVGEAAHFSSNSFAEFEYISLYLLIGITLNAVWSSSHRKMENPPSIEAFLHAPLCLIWKRRHIWLLRGFSCVNLFCHYLYSIREVVSSCFSFPVRVRKRQYFVGRVWWLLHCTEQHGWVFLFYLELSALVVTRQR